MVKSTLDQLFQVYGSDVYVDTLNVDYSEVCGESYGSQNFTVVSGSTTFVASSALHASEVGNFIVLDGNAYEIQSISGTDVVVDNAAPVAGELAGDVCYPKNLQSDLNYLRSQLQNVIGKANWYDLPDIDLHTIASIPQDSFSFISDGTFTAAASGSDTLNVEGAGGTTVEVDPATNTFIVTGPESQTMVDSDLTYASGNTWSLAGSLVDVPEDLEVYLNGVKQRKDSEYYSAVINGGNLDITFAFNTHEQQDWVNVTYKQDMLIGGGMLDWRMVTEDATVNSRDRILMDTSAVGSNAPYTLTLPAGPTIGMTIEFLDGGSNCGTIPVTILRNGSNIMGLAEDMVVDADNSAFSLVYFNEAQGWRLV